MSPDGAGSVGRERRARELPSTTAGRVVDGYWAEAKVRSPEAGGEWYLAGAWWDSPEEAVGWLHDQAERLASVLEATADCPEAVSGGGVGTVAAVFREWTTDARFRSVQCAALADGQPVSANARGTDRICGSVDVEVFYSLSARPVLRPAPCR
ncbi:hypothetical protein [Streptomyces bohaiensis]|uniref:Uncharacterized protein n=1 Tax=Streptomyces bohaiensis TaxID=1431344 RepID=A0ABX1CAT0_9ACTN|nr:hypothetical protein [Streptomyces bohaiensis]NJQ15371.1 hypothetical protein [Streptomyces bohaiensis]